MTVTLTERHIAAGRRGSPYAGPLSLAIAEALGPDPETGLPPLVAVGRGPGNPEPFEVRSAPDSWARNVRWNVRTASGDVSLPRRARFFASVFEYGPCGGADFTIRDRTGAVVALRPYAEIVRPFEFTLPLVTLPTITEEAEP